MLSSSSSSSGHSSLRIPPETIAAQSFRYQASPQEKFYKVPRLSELAAIRPVAALEKVFATCSAESLATLLQSWKIEIAACDHHPYDELRLREQFFALHDGLLDLIAAGSESLAGHPDAIKKAGNEFFDSFPVTFAKRELWDAFCAVLNKSRSVAVAVDDAVGYECLLAVVVAAYQLSEEAVTI